MGLFPFSLTLFSFPSNTHKEPNQKSNGMQEISFDKKRRHLLLQGKRQAHQQSSDGNSWDSLLASGRSVSSCLLCWTSCMTLCKPWHTSDSSWIQAEMAKEEVSYSITTLQFYWHTSGRMDEHKRQVLVRERRLYIFFFLYFTNSSWRDMKSYHREGSIIKLYTHCVGWWFDALPKHHLTKVLDNHFWSVSSLAEVKAVRRKK